MEPYKCAYIEFLPFFPLFKNCLFWNTIALKSNRLPTLFQYDNETQCNIVMTIYAYNECLIKNLINSFLMNFFYQSHYQNRIGWNNKNICIKRSWLSKSKRLRTAAIMGFVRSVSQARLKASITERLHVTKQT